MNISTQLLLRLKLDEIAGKSYTNKSGLIVGYAKPKPDIIKVCRILTATNIAVAIYVTIFGIVLEYQIKGVAECRYYKTETRLLKALADLDYVPAIALYRKILSREC